MDAMWSHDMLIFFGMARVFSLTEKMEYRVKDGKIRFNVVGNQIVIYSFFKTQAEMERLKELIAAQRILPRLNPDPRLSQDVILIYRLESGFRCGFARITFAAGLTNDARNRQIVDKFVTNAPQKYRIWKLADSILLLSESWTGDLPQAQVTAII